MCFLCLSQSPMTGLGFRGLGLGVIDIRMISCSSNGSLRS